MTNITTTAVVVLAITVNIIKSKTLYCSCYCSELAYYVDLIDVRKQQKKYQESFSKHESQNNTKVESWLTLLVAARNVTGWQINHEYEAKSLKDIVGTVLDKPLDLNSVIDENLVGMGSTRLQDLKSQLAIGSGGVRMVGIWGIGGGGKTTLASSLYKEIQGSFDSCCFLENIKNESSQLETLQEKFLSAIFREQVKVQSVDIGKHIIKGMLSSRNVLLVLDDVDNRKQLEALAGSRDWFGDGSRIIITTRDQHLLTTHSVDEVSHVRLLSDEEAIRLFNSHAYNEKNHVVDYESLSLRVVSYAGGLPLALKVLGSFLYEKDRDEWISTLNRLKDNPQMEIVEKLKISYDGLKPLEKELFLDIACFFRRERSDRAMEILEARGFQPRLGVTVLKQKGLITISSKDGTFDMHDLIQKMGEYIVRKDNPHGCLWRQKQIEDIYINVMVSVAFSRNRVGFPLRTYPKALMSSSPTSPSPSSSSSRSRKYDVFLSFRGEDTRKTFVYHLYSALVDRLISTYKDDEALSRGDDISPSLLNAIEESQIVVIIFSKNYADSSWCLDELQYIMKCRDESGQTIIPIFYDVEPSEVRNQTGEFGKAFVKQKRKNFTKIESWKKALVDASNIVGWVPKHIAGGHEAKCIKDIVGSILDKLVYLNSMDEKLVGLGTRLHDLKSQLKMESRGVLMVGIWGIGGCGKTTLASSLYMEISGKFDSCCFVGNIKDQSSKLGMETLQEKILSTVLKIEVKVPCVDIGKQLIKTRLGRRNVLLLLDDIDNLKQLEALAGSHDWFGDGSRIIITTRDKHLLVTHRVDEVYHVRLLSHEEAIKLFNSRAYNENNIVKDYNLLSQRVVSYAVGLPLALVVLGSFLYDKDTDEWISTLDRLKDIPEMEIMEKLKISYDGLQPLEKELFLDIVCFCRGMKKDEAMMMLDACGFHPRIGIKVLMQKGLVTISHIDDAFNKHDVFDMHDLVQDMGLYIVRGEYPNNPEKHSRICQPEEIEDICSRNATTANVKTEAIKCYHCPADFGKLVSNMKKLRLLYVYSLCERDIEGPHFLSNELRYMFWERYPSSTFPESFQPTKLVVLKLEKSLQKELWKNYKSLPYLKELELSFASKLVRTPDFDGLPCLQKLTLNDCSSLKEIHPSLGNHRNLVYVCVKHCEKLRKFPNIVQMGKLMIFEISFCHLLRKFPKIVVNMENLVKVSLDHVGIEALPSLVREHCINLNSLKLDNCSELKSIECNFHLSELHICGTRQPSIPYLPRFLRRLTLSRCELKDVEIMCDISELSNLQELDLSFNVFSRLNLSLSKLSQLKLLNLNGCLKLVELPELPSTVAILKADDCSSLEVVRDIHKNCKWLCQVSIRKGRSVIGGNRLLQSMLQGNAIENGCISLQLDGLEIPKGLIISRLLKKRRCTLDLEISKGFIPRLIEGSRFRLQLPENWFIHFSGFLMCAAMRRNYKIDQYITMKHERVGMTCMDFQKDVYWEDSVDDVETWVGYVSFGLLKHTTWWDQTSNEIEFFINTNDSYEESELQSGPYSGFGVRLVSNTNKTRQIETTTDSSEVSDNHTCSYSIKHDSKSELRCCFKSFK